MPSFIQQHRNVLRQPVEFGAFNNIRRFVQLYQTGVNTRLSQFQQRIQKLDVAACHTFLGDQIAYAFFHADADAFVKRALFSLKLNILNNFCFWWQILCHVSFGASQHKGRDSPGQLVLPILIVLFFYRRTILFVKRFLAT